MGKTFKDKIKRERKEVTWRTDMKALKRELMADLDKKTREQELLAIYECASLKEVKAKNKRYEAIEKEYSLTSETYSIKDEESEAIEAWEDLILNNND